MKIYKSNSKEEKITKQCKNISECIVYIKFNSLFINIVEWKLSKVFYIPNQKELRVTNPRYFEVWRTRKIVSEILQ